MSQNNAVPARTRFNLLDILQIIGGLILLNAILSYLITSSTTWGYGGRYLDPHYYKHVLKGYPQKEYTAESLLEETQNSGRLLLSINRQVYDVTSNRALYDSNYVTARYASFVGRDCTRMYLNGCFGNSEQCTWDLRNIGYTEKWVNQSVDHWVRFYENNPRYWRVGYLNVGNESEYPIPEKCMDGVKYPL